MRSMKQFLQLFVAIIITAICLTSGGCELTYWARLVNRTNHAIVVRQKEGKTISIAPGANAPIPLWDITEGQRNGFVVLDGGKEFFYSLYSDTEANREDPRSSKALLPSVCAIRKYGGIGFFFDYADDSRLFALAPSTENPARANPQPNGFPFKPIEIITLRPFTDTYYWYDFTLSREAPLSADGRYRFVRVRPNGDVELIDSAWQDIATKVVVAKAPPKHFIKGQPLPTIVVSESNYEKQTANLRDLRIR